MLDYYNVSVLEIEILLIVWKKGKVTVRNVCEALLISGDDRFKYIPYTTVMSVMKRLNGKNALRRIRLKNTDIYSAKINNKELFKSITRLVAEKLLK